MRKSIILLFLLAINISWAQAETCHQRWEKYLQEYELNPIYESLIDNCDRDLKKKLKAIIDGNKDLGYTTARQKMFSQVDNNDGEVCGVYTGICLKTSGIPDANRMNCEHSWPQSMGAVGIAKSDLHHLFPADSRMNSRRSNYPFCEVSDASYQGYGSALGESEFGTRCFEPRDEHKGTVARAMLYFSVRYTKVLDSQQEGFLKKWNEQFATSDNERARNEVVERLQKNRNPFIDHPWLVELIVDF